MTSASSWLTSLKEDLRRIVAGSHHDPHGVLGARLRDGRMTVLAYLPAATLARLERRHELRRVRGTDFFAWQGPPPGDLPAHHRLSWIDSHGSLHEQVDPYSFAPTISA